MPRNLATCPDRSVRRVHPGNRLLREWSIGLSEQNHGVVHLTADSSKEANRIPLSFDGRKSQGSRLLELDESLSREHRALVRKGIPSLTGSARGGGCSMGD